MCREPAARVSQGKAMKPKHHYCHGPVSRHTCTKGVQDGSGLRQRGINARPPFDKRAAGAELCLTRPSVAPGRPGAEEPSVRLIKTPASGRPVLVNLSGARICAGGLPSVIYPERWQRSSH